MPKPWPLLKSEPGPSYRVFSLRTDTARSPRTGTSHRFHLLECADWVNVIPVTPDGQVVMVKQYRHGIRQVTLEVPGGMVDPGTTPLESARRELREETGYHADELVLIGTLHPHPALMNNRCLTYLAEGAVKAGEIDQEVSEDLEVALVPLGQIPGLIRSGEITHSLVIAAFYWYFSRRGWLDP